MISAAACAWIGVNDDFDFIDIGNNNSSPNTKQDASNLAKILAPRTNNGDLLPKPLIITGT